jgi:hypothetical protein
VLSVIPTTASAVPTCASLLERLSLFYDRVARFSRESQPISLSRFI